jgi:hypothetical protein
VQYQQMREYPVWASVVDVWLTLHHEDGSNTRHTPRIIALPIQRRYLTARNYIERTARWQAASH